MKVPGWGGGTENYGREWFPGRFAGRTGENGAILFSLVGVILVIGRGWPKGAVWELGLHGGAS